MPPLEVKQSRWRDCLLLKRLRRRKGEASGSFEREREQETNARAETKGEVIDSMLGAAAVASKGKSTPGGVSFFLFRKNFIAGKRTCE